MQIKKKKNKKNIFTGRIYIKASYNNTIITITDLIGNVLSWRSSGCEGFKGTKKSTPYAAQISAKSLSKKIRNTYNIFSVEIYIKGPGPGRESAIRSLSNFFRIIYIADITSIPHNGCRPPKERRV